ncbi:hypothetical protein JCM10212_001792, partial [Sporobolomyces blumeae]
MLVYSLRLALLLVLGTLASSVVAASSFFDSDGIDGLGGFGDSSFGIGSPFEG